MKTNAELEKDVKDELVYDPSVKDEQDIAVGAHDGTVTLRGTVGSFHQRRVAEAAAKRVAGTTDVDNQLEVRLLDDWNRGDAEIRGAALQALMWNASVPADRLDVSVDLGHVVLCGTVDWRYEKDAAEAAVSSLVGVVGVRNEIEVAAPMIELGEMSLRLQDAFRRHAQTDADAIEITVADGHVVLSGDVGSWAEHDAAMAAAYAAPGVRDVDDRLTVTG